MRFVVYILYSQGLDQYYIGHTQDLTDRYNRHLHHGSKSTKKVNDWRVVYQETYDTRSDAMRREIEIKSKKSRKYLEFLIAGSP